MPELPEVEQVRKTLSPHVVGKKIKALDIRLKRLIHHPSANEFEKKVVGKTITSIDRHGKYLKVNLDKDLYILIHLRMTGALMAVPKKAPEPSYAKIEFTLTGDYNMWFTDIRTFGTLDLIDHNDYVVEGFSTLGPEPCTKELRAKYLYGITQKAKGPIKALILNQKVIAGLGNIYADEALFVSGILPMRLASTLTLKDCESLVKAINKVIKQGIKNHGTTFRDYKDGEGNQGSNQKHLFVYGRRLEGCLKCGRELSYTKVAGRGTTYCSKCQH